jgi:hypothetical protein
MAAEKRKKIKLMIVIGLSAVFVTIAYFRFMSKNEAPAASVAAPQMSIPDVEIKNRLIDSGPTSSDSIRHRFVKRDIFTPLNRPISEKAEKKPAVQNPANEPPPEPIARPSLKLGGTIVGGSQPIAIINDQFVRTGEIINGFTVVQIGKFAVDLASGKKTIRLEMIDND